MKFVGRLIGFTALLVGCFGFGFGWSDLRKGESPSPEAFAALLGSDTESRSNAEVFRENYDRILADYEGKVDPADLKWSGMEGLFGAIGDPHTLFLRPQLAKEFQIDTSAQLVGIGARLRGDELGAQVATVFDDSPALEAGLKPNDIISSVDGVSVLGMDVNSIVDKVRGQEGTVVRLTIIRKGVKEPLQISCTRKRIIAPTVDSIYLEKQGVGVLQVVSFSQPTARQFARALDDLDRRDLKGLVIDLRNNPGGLLETTVELLSFFFDSKPVMKMKGRGGREEVVHTRASEVRVMPYPVAVLINEESASASEIFAGVLQEHKRATLIGEHSYGKASVQDIRRIADSSSAKITIARYLLPSGRDIGRRVDEEGMYISGGLEPDIKVEFPMEAGNYFGDPEKDPQMKEALRVIQEKRGDL